MLNPLPLQSSQPTEMDAQISEVRLAAAHEGMAELIVTLRYENGGESHIPLAPDASHILMRRCAATSAEDLIGHNWTLVRDALTEAYNPMTTTVHDAESGKRRP